MIKNNRFFTRKAVNMTQSTGRLLHWVPRILGIFFAVFLGIFALDVFEPGTPLQQAIVGFLIHLAPSFLVLLSLALAWRRGWLGSACFVGLGILYLAMSWGRFPISVYLLISGPLFLIGLLFLADWMYTRHPGHA